MEEAYPLVASQSDADEPASLIRILGQSCNGARFKIGAPLWAIFEYLGFLLASQDVIQKLNWADVGLPSTWEHVSVFFYFWYWSYTGLMLATNITILLHPMMDQYITTVQT